MAMENDQNNGGGFHFHIYGSGNQCAQSITNTFNGNIYNGQSTQEKPQFTDEQIGKALTVINGQGKALNSKQKWAGAYWLLRWLCNYPIASNAFCDKVNKLPQHAEWEFECSYNNIRPLTTLSFMNYDPQEMDKVKYSPNDENAYLQCREVVQALTQELKKFIR